jgi:hypothetical protein
MRDLFHLLGEEGSAEDFEQSQNALHLMEIRCAALEQHDVLGLLDESLEGSARLPKRVVQLAADEVKRL